MIDREYHVRIRTTQRDVVRVIASSVEEARTIVKAGGGAVLVDGEVIFGEEILTIDDMGSVENAPYQAIMNKEK